MSYKYNCHNFVLYKRYYATHHAVTTAINRFLKVVQAKQCFKSKKVQEFQVVTNLITVTESNSKFELACDKVINQTYFQK